jgi:para-aminobenzoate synthetase
MFLFTDRLIAFDHFKKQMYLVCLVELSLDGEPDWMVETEATLQSMDSVLCLTTEENHTATEKGNIQLMHSREEYIQNIHKSLGFIRDGESYELCLTTQLSGQVDVTSVRPFNFYRTLRHKNPAPYGGYLKTPSHTLACSSPELFMHLESTRDVYMKPIKGTLKREPFDASRMTYEQWKQRDEESKKWLENNEKDRAENLMVMWLNFCGY